MGSSCAATFQKWCQWNRFWIPEHLMIRWKAYQRWTARTRLGQSCCRMCRHPSWWDRSIQQNKGVLWWKNNKIQQKDSARCHIFTFTVYWDCTLPWSTGTGNVAARSHKACSNIANSLPPPWRLLLRLRQQVAIGSSTCCHRIHLLFVECRGW